MRSAAKVILKKESAAVTPVRDPRSMELGSGKVVGMLTQSILNDGVNVTEGFLHYGKPKTMYFVRISVIIL